MAEVLELLISAPEVKFLMVPELFPSDAGLCRNRDFHTSLERIDRLNETDRHHQ